MQSVVSCVTGPHNRTLTCRQHWVKWQATKTRRVPASWAGSFQVGTLEAEIPRQVVCAYSLWLWDLGVWVSLSLMLTLALPQARGQPQAWSPSPWERGKAGPASRQAAMFSKLCPPHLLIFLASGSWFALEYAGGAGRRRSRGLTWPHAVLDIRGGSRLRGEMRTQPQGWEAGVAGLCRWLPSISRAVFTPLSSPLYESSSR